MTYFRVQVHCGNGSCGSLRNGLKTGYPAKTGTLVGAVSAEQKLDDLGKFLTKKKQQKNKKQKRYQFSERSIGLVEYIHVQCMIV